MHLNDGANVFALGISANTVLLVVLRTYSDFRKRTVRQAAKGLALDSDITKEQIVVLTRVLINGLPGFRWFVRGCGVVFGLSAACLVGSTFALIFGAVHPKAIWPDWMFILVSLFILVISPVVVAGYVGTIRWLANEFELRDDLGQTFKVVFELALYYDQTQREIDDLVSRVDAHLRKRRKAKLERIIRAIERPDLEIRNYLAARRADRIMREALRDKNEE
jgi:hypothetical protein